MNLNYADAGRALAWNVNGVLREYFNPVVWGSPDPAGLRVPGRQVLDGRRKDRHDVYPRRTGS